MEQVKTDKRVAVLGDGLIARSMASYGYDILTKQQFYVERPQDADRGHDAQRAYIASKLIGYDAVLCAIGGELTHIGTAHSKFADLLWSNCDVPVLVSQVCNDLSIKMVHIGVASYDPSENNPSGRYEHCELVAKGDYMITKVLAEKMVHTNNRNALLLRCANFTSDIPHNNNWLSRIVALGSSTSNAVCITTPDCIALAVSAALMVDNGPFGMVNAVCGGTISGELVRYMVQKQSAGVVYNRYDNSTKFPTLRGEFGNMRFCELVRDALGKSGLIPHAHGQIEKLLPLLASATTRGERNKTHNPTTQALGIKPHIFK